MSSAQLRVNLQLDESSQTPNLWSNLTRKAILINVDHLKFSQRRKQPAREHPVKLIVCNRSKKVNAILAPSPSHGILRKKKLIQKLLGGLTIL